MDSRYITRMFSAGNDADRLQLQQERKRVVRDASGARHESPDVADVVDVADVAASARSDKYYCRCFEMELEESFNASDTDSHSQSSTTSRRCPVGPCDLPVRLTSNRVFSVEEVMAFGTCYTPMKPFKVYQSETVFLYALLGMYRESFVLASLYQLPFDPCLRSRDSEGNTLLMLACTAEYPSHAVLHQIVHSCSPDFLREYLNAANNEGLSALHFAALNNQPYLVHMLLELGADPNAGSVDIDGKGNCVGITPAMMSILGEPHGGGHCLELLLNKDVDLSVEMVKPHSGGLSFVDECRCGGCHSADPFFTPLAPAHIKTNTFVKQGNILYLAARLGSTTHLIMLLNKLEEQVALKKVSRKTMTRDHLTVLGIACKFLYRSCLEVILMKVPSLVSCTQRYKDKELMTPLHIMLSFNRLLDSDFIHVRCGLPSRFSPHAMTEKMDMILNIPGIDVNARNQRQETPLMLAASQGHDYIMEKLLNMGADPFTVDERGNSPASLAMELEPEVRFNVLRILFKTGLNHKIGRETYQESVVLNKLLNTKDLILLQMFLKAGAINQTSRSQMHLVVTATPDDDWESPQAKAEYLQVLGNFTPQSLKDLVALSLSAPLGLKTPEERVSCLKKTINCIELIADNGDKERDSDNRDRDGGREAETADGSKAQTDSQHQAGAAGESSDVRADTPRSAQQPTEELGDFWQFYRHAFRDVHVA